jgi:peptidoglycan hydrolase-like protein with peptidoglycan-binding domain
MEHTGFGLNNETVECSSGVQHFTTRNKKWTHWGIPACVDGTITTSTPDDDDDEDVGFPDPSPRRLSIRRGDKGDDVKECQTMLKALGYDLGKCGIDGDYGSMTRLAVICFQRDHGLVADGICGPLTWEALDTAFKSSAGTPVTSTNTYSVIIRGLDQTQAHALAANYPASSEIIEGSDGK